MSVPTTARVVNNGGLGATPSGEGGLDDCLPRTALGWVEAGAGIVGGCCGIGAAHIRALAGALRGAGHRIA